MTDDEVRIEFTKRQLSIALTEAMEAGGDPAAVVHWVEALIDAKVIELLKSFASAVNPK